MQKLRTFWEISRVIIFHFIEIMKILLELAYLRVLSLCSAPSCHHHKWSWMSIVSIFGAQDLPSTCVRHLSGERWFVVDFVNSFIDELQQFRHRCCNLSEFDEALLSEAKRSCDQKMNVAFRLLKFEMKLKPWDEVKIHGKERIRCRDEDSGVEAEIRKAVCGRKSSGWDSNQFPELVEEFEAKRDLGSEAEESVDCLHFWVYKHCFLEGVKQWLR